MQEVFLKACEEGAHVVAIVLELKGNPSRITFYDVSGEELAYILMNVAIPRRREFNIDRKKSYSQSRGGRVTSINIFTVLNSP